MVRRCWPRTAITNSIVLQSATIVKLPPTFDPAHQLEQAYTVITVRDSSMQHEMSSYYALLLIILFTGIKTVEKREKENLINLHK